MELIILFLLPIVACVALNSRVHSSQLGRWGWGIRWICAIIIWTILWVQTEISIGKGWTDIISMEWKYQCLGVATVSVPFWIVYILICRVNLACFFTTIVWTIISIANYYTIMYHGMPLSIFDIKNLTTAVDVIGSYKLAIDSSIKEILLVYFCAITLSFVIKCVENRQKTDTKERVISSVTGIFVITLTLFGGYFGSTPIKPLRTIGWTWTEPYSQYGYAPCSVEMIYYYFNAIQKPDGYTDKLVQEIEIEQKNDEVYQTPDVVLILNESFYDLSLIANFTTDIGYLDNFTSLENAVKGYCVVSSPGGGTNCSEYELLTSNSLRLMPAVTPFNHLNLQGANSIVSVLKTLGYHTIGSHPKSGTNYNRRKGYAALGFDDIFFDDDFKDLAFYKNRWRETDESVYQNLERWYEENIHDTQEPLFLYNLTFQNHGEWSDLSEEDYLVHVNEDFGEYTSTMNEYLTSISLSDAAIGDLIDYFSGVDRPVILCMVGDHCPSFAGNIVKDGMSEDEKKLKLRSVPFLIWSNKSFETENIGYLGMNMLVPEIFELAGIKQSPYYAYLNDLKREIPVITAYDTYYDAAGNTYSYSADNEYKDKINQYFYMEYNNVASSKRRDELFTVTSDNGNN